MARNSRGGGAAGAPADMTLAERNLAPPQGYCFIATFLTGSSAGRPMAADGRLVLFDTVAMAQNFLPKLGTGRTTVWDRDGETAHWMEIEANGISKAVIVTGYDPYDVPVAFPGGIRSESRVRDWQHHVMWSHAFTDCGQIARRADGTLVNTALIPA